METKNIRDRLVKKPGMLGHTGVEDSMLLMMSVNLQDVLLPETLGMNIDILSTTLQGLQWVSA